MFTPQQRQAVRDVARSRALAMTMPVTAAALVGSAATGREDRWSDIDLMVRLAPGLAALRGRRRLDRVDVRRARGGDPSRRVDLGSGAVPGVPDPRLAPGGRLSSGPTATSSERGPTGFELLHGETNPPRLLAVRPTHENLVGEAWLYALHVRSALARGRTWQADHLDQRTPRPDGAAGVPPHRTGDVRRPRGRPARLCLAGPPSRRPGAPGHRIAADRGFAARRTAPTDATHGG